MKTAGRKVPPFFIVKKQKMIVLFCYIYIKLLRINDISIDKITVE